MRLIIYFLLLISCGFSEASVKGWRRLQCALEVVFNENQKELPYALIDRIKLQAMTLGVDAAEFDTVRGFKKFESTLIVWVSRPSEEIRNLEHHALFAVDLTNGELSLLHTDLFITAFVVAPQTMYIAHRNTTKTGIRAQTEDIKIYSMDREMKRPLKELSTPYYKSVEPWVFERDAPVGGDPSIVEFEVRLGKFFVRRAFEPEGTPLKPLVEESTTYVPYADAKRNRRSMQQNF